MKIKIILILSSIFFLSVQILHLQEKVVPVLTGPYLGQKPPGKTPELFAPGIVSTSEDEYALEISADGNEILFIRNSAIMLATRSEDGTWNRPAVAPFSGKDIDGEPCFAPSGKKIYFSSRRPHPQSKKARNIWFVEKKNGVWENPAILILPYEKDIHALSVAGNGNIYEDGVIRFPYLNGKYHTPENLNPPVKGFFPFVAPDESYIISSIKPKRKSDADLYISFKKSKGSWIDPVSMAKDINSSSSEGNSFVTTDGKYLFFSKKYDIYWVDARIIEDLRPKK